LDLGKSEQVVHLTALLLTAVSAAVIMTPAAYHRQAERGQVSDYLIKLASRLIALAMLPLMIGICLDAYVVSRMILENTTAVAIALALLCLFSILWFIFPRLHRRKPPKA